MPLCVGATCNIESCWVLACLLILHKLNMFNRANARPHNVSDLFFRLRCLRMNDTGHLGLFTLKCCALIRAAYGCCRPAWLKQDISAICKFYCNMSKVSGLGLLAHTNIDLLIGSHY